MSQGGAVVAAFVIAEGMLLASPDIEFCGLSVNKKVQKSIFNQIEDEITKLLRNNKSKTEIEIQLKKYIKTIGQKKLRKNILAVVKAMEV